MSIGGKEGRNNHQPTSEKAMNNPTAEAIARQFRKKPVVIEAQQLDRQNGPQLAEWCAGQWLSLYGRGDKGEDISHISINTLEGTMRADLGDWIIRGVKGEFYPCKPDIFAATYEAIDASRAEQAGGGADASARYLWERFAESEEDDWGNESQCVKNRWRGLARDCIALSHPQRPDGGEVRLLSYTPPQDLHPETISLVVRFAEALSQKLLSAQEKYGYTDGWKSDDWMDECRQKLWEHLQKGDPRDVAAYCAFLWHHGESTAPAPPAVGDGFTEVGFRYRVCPAEYRSREWIGSGIVAEWNKPTPNEKDIIEYQTLYVANTAPPSREVGDDLAERNWNDDVANAMRILRHARSHIPDEVLSEIETRLSAAPRQVVGEACAFITHSADELSRMDMTQAGMELGVGKHPLFAQPAPGAVDELLRAVADDYQDILASGRPTGSSDSILKRVSDAIRPGG